MLLLVPYAARFHQFSLMSDLVSDFYTSFYLNFYVHLFFIFGYIGYSFSHMYRSMPLLKKTGKALTLIDKLLITRVPWWKPSEKLDSELEQSKRLLAREFFIASMVFSFFYITFVGFGILIFFNLGHH